ncbi:hypothetical protein ACFLXI_00530 [Chloroflexota bacterium]
MFIRYLSIKKFSLPLLLVALLLLLVVIPVLSAQVTLLDDGFELTPIFQNWDDNGTTNWSTSPSVFHNGTRSARASNNSEGLLTSDDLDTSDAKTVQVDFWFQKTSTTNTDFTLYYYDGSSYDLIAELDGEGADDTWLHYSDTITDSQYFVSNFRIQFDATLTTNGKAYVDDVLITKDTGEILTVTTSGAGSGTVTSSPGEIDCGSECDETYATNTVVTLTASPDPGSLFAGWSGAGCDGTDTCVVTMDAAKTVDANFIPGALLTVSVDGTGSGTVTSSPDGIDCESNCEETYTYGTVVTLTAVPATGSIFSGWSGAGCDGTGTCVVTMDAARSVTATFVPGYTLSVIKDGAGTVTSIPAGIDCGLDCNHDYFYNEEVTLTATADPGWTFDSWSGEGCSSNGTCVVTMSVARSVTATFTQDQYTLTANVTGQGSVGKSPDQATYIYDDVVTLTATEDPGWTFTGWSGDVTSTDNPLQVTIQGNTSVTATFTKGTYTLSVSNTGTGVGKVTSSPSGIDCETDCSEDYIHNTVVTLSADAHIDSTFMGWSGAGCTGTGTCVITMDMAKSVTAEFKQTNFPLYLPLILKP